MNEIYKDSFKIGIFSGLLLSMIIIINAACGLVFILTNQNNDIYHILELVVFAISMILIAIVSLIIGIITVRKALQKSKSILGSSIATLISGVTSGILSNVIAFIILTILITIYLSANIYLGDSSSGETTKFVFDEFIVTLIGLWVVVYLIYAIFLLLINVILSFIGGILYSIVALMTGKKNKEFSQKTQT